MRLIKKIICAMVAITMCISTSCKEIETNKYLENDKNKINYNNFQLDNCFKEDSRNEINLDDISYMDSIDDEIYIFGKSYNYGIEGFYETENSDESYTGDKDFYGKEICTIRDKNGEEKTRFRIPILDNKQGMSYQNVYSLNQDKTITFIDGDYYGKEEIKVLFLNKNGEITEEIKLNKDKIFKEPNVCIKDFIKTKNNDFFIFYTKNDIYNNISLNDIYNDVLLIDSKGNLKKKIDKLDGQIIKNILYNDEQYYVIYEEDSTYKIGILDIENQKIDELDILENYNGESIKKSDGKYLFTFENFNQTSIWGYEKEKGNIVEIFNFLNTGIYNHKYGNVIINKEGLYVLGPNLYYIRNYNEEVFNDGGNIYVSKYIPLNKDNTNNKKIITVGTCKLSEDMNYAIEKFNNENNNYQIYIRNYSDYVNNDDREASKLLNDDLTNGNIPDIILFGNYYEIESLINRGILTDLNEFIKKDEMIRKDDYLEKAFGAFEKDDKLYAFFPSFSVDTMIGFESDLGEKQGWDIDELTSFSKENNDKKLLLSRDKRELFESFLSLYMDEYIDYDKNTCNFKKESFVKILELIKENNNNILTQNDILKEDNYQYNSYLSKSKDDIYLKKFNFNNFQYIRNYFAQYNHNKPVLKGMPSKEGNGAALLPNFTIAISEQSEHKEMAWEFIKIFLQDDFQNNDVTFPIKKSYYEYRTNMKFENSIYEYIKQTSKVNIVDTNIIDIIEKEYNDFESDKKTATQVAKSTQKKVTQYLNEIK